MDGLGRLESDIEFCGKLAEVIVAPSGRAGFALLLAMQDPDITTRPSIKEYHPSPTSSVPVSHYPKPGLSSSERDWQTGRVATNFLAAGDIANSRLWLTMHPQALAQYDDAKRIHPEVLANCSLTARQRASGHQPDTAQQADISRLFDLLEEIHQAA